MYARQSFKDNFLTINTCISKGINNKSAITATIKVCTVTHDMVYYVFAHRKELDFESVLDESGTIALLWSLWNSSQDWYMEVDGPICGHDERTSYVISNKQNWSSVGVDAPYTWCCV